MNFGISEVAMEVALNGFSARQNIIAQNIANINTPGYKSETLSFQHALAAGIKARNLSHVPFTITESSGSQVTNGNNVSLDQEMTALLQNSLDYTTTLSQEQNYWKNLDFIEAHA